MPLFKYEAVIAKCRCLYGKMLSHEDYDFLLKCTTISEAAVYLHDKTSYSEFLGVSDLKKINRNKLEYYIKKALLNDFIKIFRFTSGTDRDFINLLMAKYELEYILKIWRHFVWKSSNPNAIKDTEEDEYLIDSGILELQAIYQNNNRINFSVMKDIKSPEQFLEAIRETYYYKIFASHIDEDIAHDYTKIETAVYNEYYSLLWSGTRAFDSDTKSALQNIVGINADLINLAIMARLIFNFKYNPEDITKYLVPLRNKLRESDIAELINMSSRDDFIRYCEKNLYFGRKLSFSQYETVTQYMAAFLFKYYRSRLIHTKTGFDTVVKYFFVKEMEVKNLFCIIEGIRYSMSAEQIKKYLIGVDDLHYGGGV